MNSVIHLTKLLLGSSWLVDGCGHVDNLQTTINTVHLATQLGSFWQRRQLWRLESTFEGLYGPNNMVFVKLESGNGAFFKLRNCEFGGGEAMSMIYSQHHFHPFASVES